MGVCVCVFSLRSAIPTITGVCADTLKCPFSFIPVADCHYNTGGSQRCDELLYMRRLWSK